MAIEAIPYVAVPCGWMKCVACSDFKTQPGTMWLGKTKGGSDETIVCPVCHGTGQVTRLRYLDARTGQEIDYESPGQIFVKTGEFETAIEPQAPDKRIFT